MTQRSASVERKTNETAVAVSVNLDGQGSATIATGVGFFDHMLDQIARHGLLDLTVQCDGDLHVDAHHTVEDVGIALGQALRKALGDGRGIRRFGEACVPLDEALSRSVIDISGRPGCYVHGTIANARVGEMDTELVEEFFVGLANHAMITVHIELVHGKNTHHIVETVFKSFGRALREALSEDVRLNGAIPSTKGSL